MSSLGVVCNGVRVRIRTSQPWHVISEPVYKLKVLPLAFVLMLFVRMMLGLACKCFRKVRDLLQLVHLANYKLRRILANIFAHACIVFAQYTQFW